jgi:hypothetical protein
MQPAPYLLKDEVTIKRRHVNTLSDWNAVSFRKRHGAMKKLRGLSLRGNCTDRATAAYRKSQWHLLWIEGATWSA